ncbi:MAG: hypothetical protein PHS30_02755 [Bacteroidales bacterium]|nr:hypothetical protein [Bacteroidales bacterium]
MRILIVNHGIIPVKLYGGTGRVIWYLGKELAKLGHQITFLVTKGSTCNFASVLYIDETKSIVEQIPLGFDLIHFHLRPDGLDTLRTPYIITMHGNKSPLKELDKNTVFVSQNHAKRFSSNSFVYNGLDWDDYVKPDLNHERSYFHFLGNAAWKVKNVKGAIGVINHLPSERLTVLGGVRFNLKMGMRFTFSPKVRFKGMVGGE